MTKSRKQIIFYAIFSAILLFSTVWKFLFINKRELWLDETYSCFVAKHSFTEMMYFIRGDVHPPLYYLLLKSWSLLFGLSPFSVKSLSVVISIAASIFFYFLVMKIIKVQWISMFCFFLFQFSPVLFYYSTETRMYMLATLLAIISLYYFYDVFNAEEYSFTLSLYFSISCVLLFYIHYTGIFLIISYLICYAVSAVNVELKFKYILYSVIVFTILTAPWYSTLYNQKIRQTEHRQALVIANDNSETINYSGTEEKTAHPSFDLKKFIIRDTETMSSLIGVYPFKNYYIMFFANISIVILLIYGLSMLRDESNKYCRMLLIIIAIFYVIALYFNIHSRRLYIMLVPFYIIMMGYVINAMYSVNKQRLLYIILLLSLSIIYIAGVARVYNKYYCNINTIIVKYIQDRYKYNDVVVFNSLYYEVPFDYYATLSGFSPFKIGFPVSIYQWWYSQPFAGWGGPIISRKILKQFMDNLLADHRINSIWLILFENNYYDPNNMLLKELVIRSISFDKCKLPISGCEDNTNIHYGVYRIKMATQ